MRTPPWRSLWLSAEKAKLFLSLRLNEQTKESSDEIVKEEPNSLGCDIYARNYELFYS
jgi:hypothetical protein